MRQKPTFIQINSGMRLQNQEFDNLSAVCHEHENRSAQRDVLDRQALVAERGRLIKPVEMMARR
jgi:hypothetical protein